jgi:hypothetical protein
MLTNLQKRANHAQGGQYAINSLACGERAAIEVISNSSVPPPELRRVLLAHQLFVQRIRFGRFACLSKDARPIVIQRQGPSVPLDQLLHQLKVASRIFLLAQHGRHQLARRIIDGSDQGQPGASLTQPRMMTPIDLHQHSFLYIACAATAMKPSPLFPGRTHSRCNQHATYTRSREVNALAFGQEIA